MSLEIRQTLPGDVAAAELVLNDGKAALAELDIPQWMGEYPNRVDIEADMAEGASYVAVGKDGTVLAVMALSFSGEDTYDAIDGSWLTTSDSRDPRYAVIHRCAIGASAARQGIMTKMFLMGEDVAREHGMESVRVDTHERNIRVRGLVEKLGYTRCGTITLPHEDEVDPLRIAFEKVL